VDSLTTHPLKSRGKTPVPIGQMGGWAPKPISIPWRRQKLSFLTLPEIEPRSFNP